MPTTAASHHRHYRVLGVNIDGLSMAEAAAAICQRCQESGAVYVTKPYVEFIDRALSDADIKKLLNNSWLCLPDGVSLQWAAAYLYGGKKGFGRAFGLAASIVLAPHRVRSVLPERFSGATFTWKLLEQAAAEGRSLYLMGSPVDSSIEQTVQVIKQRLPEVKIVGSHAGELKGKSQQELLLALQRGENIADDLAAELRKLKPDIILLGLGFPIQELLMSQLAAKLDRGVLVGEGGTFDFDSFGGKRRRAPGWMRRLGIEWLWRLILEPKRLGRQLAIPRFMLAVYNDARRRPKNYSQ